MELLRACILVGAVGAMVAAMVKYHSVVEEALRQFHDTWRGGGGGGGPIGPAPAADPFVRRPGQRRRGRQTEERNDYSY